MKTKSKWMMALGTAILGVSIAIPGCKKEEAEAPGITPAEVAAREKAAADKALADKAGTDKAAADRLAAEKMAADRAAADKSAAVEMALADKAAADKMVAEAEAKKAAAARLAEQEKAEAGALPTDLLLMKSEMTQAMAQIDLTLAKLEVLAASTGNLKQPSQDSLAAIDALDASTQSIKKRADDMRTRGAAYFDAWDKQLAAMSTPEVAALAAKRKDELSVKYAEILAAMQEARSAFDPFWSEIQTIRKAVDDGLKADGQKALVGQIKSARDKSTTVKTRVEAVSSRLNDVSVIYKRP